MKKNKKKVIITIVCIIAVWFIVSVVDFVLVHNYRKPLFCVLQGNVTEVHENYMIMHIAASGYPYGAECSVSLTPVFGNSYTDVSVGDEIVVYFDGNIAETDPLQFGTVYAIILKTPADGEAVS